MENVIFNLPPHGDTRFFELHMTSNKTPCIVGNAKKQMGEDDDIFISVYQPAGGRTKMYPLPVKDSCLYEIFIGVLERVDSKLFVNTFCITNIDDSKNCVVAVHTVL